MKFLSIAFLALALRVANGQKQQIPLNSHSTLSIPLLGYGTWNLDKSNASEAVSYAIETGYRHIDCAAAYGNEKEVGKGIADGLKKAGLKRSDIWVTSKLWNDHHRPDLVFKGLEETISDLGLDYVDLYHMHWPTWHAMERLLHTGKVRHIGVSNFSPAQLENLIAKSKTTPFAHQMELHPYLQQTAWVQWHYNHGIHVTAYSPLANSNPTYGGPKKGSTPALLDNTVINDIAKESGCTPATVALAWGMSRGTSVIPKSQHKERISENFGAMDCVMGYEGFRKIEDVGRKYLHRFNNPSKTWGVPLYEGLDDA
ncbi:hypothetical protein MMC17_002818 [Xylographa soralifera]|nr:hypothetical protein [Xylographa soralifera]